MTDEQNKESNPQQDITTDSKKQVAADISIEELYTSGIGEKESLNAYRTQAAKNTLFQLRTMLVNIDEERFPERYKIIKETIEAKENDLDPLAKLQKEEQIRKKQENAKKREEQKKLDEEEARKNASTNDQTTRFYFKFIIFIILFSYYVILCNFVDLPGKNYMLLLVK